jgi:abequosyltransferase
MAKTARQADQPRLTIAIPTFNRARFLTELLDCLQPQIAAVPPGSVELLVVDNASDDATPAVVASFIEHGLACRPMRNATNIGADANFLRCFELAQGQYVWVLGDDDLLMPGALAELLSLLDQADYDLVYLSTFGFSGELDTANLAAAQTSSFQLRGETADRLGRHAEVVTDGAYFLGKVNALIGLISANIVNKNRLLAIPHPPIQELVGTNLVQVGWLFPLLRQPVSILYVWRRLVAYRAFNSGGWGACEVFGIRLSRIAGEYFQSEPWLASALVSNVLRYWMLNAIFDIRTGQHGGMHEEAFARDLRRVFGGNWRFWIFLYPVATLPLPLARPVFRLYSAVNRLTRIGQGMLRHWFGHGQYVRS